MSGLKGAVIITLVVLSTIFIMQNTEVVEITFLFWRASLSKVLVIAGSLSAGFLIGLLLGWELFSRRPRKSEGAGV